jgi:GT2 family glycosyltransferase
VVIITRNRAEAVLNSVRRAVELDEHPSVVVVDNGSDDGTADAVRQAFRSVLVIALCANIGSAARNVGARVAGCQYTAFADDDSWWAPESLTRAVSAMDEGPDTALVAGTVLVGADGRLDPVSASMASGPLSGSLETSAEGRRAVTGGLACSMVVRTAPFLAVGGFPAPVGVGGEEQTVVWDLLAAGWRAVYEPSVVAHHHPSASRDPARRRVVVGRNDLWAAWSRLPAIRAAAMTAGAARRPAASGLVDAVRAGRWALARRAVLPVRVEAARRMLAG